MQLSNMIGKNVRVETMDAIYIVAKLLGFSSTNIQVSFKRMTEKKGMVTFQDTIPRKRIRMIAPLDTILS